MKPTVTIDELYHDCHQITLEELRGHLENIASLGIIDPLQAMWAVKEIDWDIDHLLVAVGRLDRK